MLFRLSGKITLNTDKHQLDKQHLNWVNKKRAVILTCFKGDRNTIKSDIKFIFVLTHKEICDVKCNEYINYMQ